MIDESSDTDNLQDSPQPWAFHSRPAWQWFLTTLKGIIFFNLASDITIWIRLTYKMGYTYLPKDEVNKYGIIRQATYLGKWVLKQGIKLSKSMEKILKILMIF